MITVGGRRVLDTSSIIVPMNEEAVVRCEFDEKDNVTVVFSFSDLIDDEDKENKPSIRVTGGDDRSHVQFNNFNSSTGHTLGKPIKFAESDSGERITFMATVYKYRLAHRIQYQIMAGGSDE